MNFKIDKKNLKWGFDSSINLFKVELNEETCTVQHSGELEGWFAAYVVVPPNCAQWKIADQLVTMGADYIFLNGDGNEEEFKLHSNGLSVPIFLPKMKKTTAPFCDEVENIIGAQEVNEEGKLYNKSIKLHITLPLVRILRICSCLSRHF